MNTINEKGIAEIRVFLGRKHKLGADHFNADMLAAWAQTAEFNLSDGNGALIEIPAYDSVSGHTESFEVSEDGIDHA